MTPESRAQSFTAASLTRSGDEARSPPGRWRLVTAGALTWVITSCVIPIPGLAWPIALACGLLGTAILAFLLFTTLTAQAQRGKNSAELLARVARLGASMLLLPLSVVTLVTAHTALIEQSRYDPALLDIAGKRTLVQIRATVTGYPSSSESAFGTRAWVRASFDAGTASVPLLLWLESTTTLPNRLGPGTVIEFPARLTKQAPADQAAFTANVGEIRQVEPNTPTAWVHEKVGAGAALLRERLHDIARNVAGGELVPGLAVGDTSLVTARLEADMLESSLSHLTAVSGSNTGLVITAVMWCATRLGARRRLRALMAGFGLVGFVVIVGPDASVYRAAVMATVLLISDFGGKRANSLPALGGAMIVLLAADPWQALQPGFALSVTATAGILLAGSPVSHWLETRLRFPRVLSLPLALALTAQLACGPLLLLLQPGLPVVGVLANVLAAPAAPLGTGIGLLALVLTPLSQPLGTLFVQFAALPAQWIAATAAVCANWPGGRWNWPGGWLGTALLAGCELALLIAWALHSGRLRLWSNQPAQVRPPWQRRQEAPLRARVTAWILTGAGFGALVAITLANPLLVALGTPKDWSIVACDVGQGDAILLRDLRKPDKVVLIDTGDDEALLAECLHRFGVDRISLLVLSHDDRDHVGALDSIIARVDEALISPTVRGESTSARVPVDALTQEGIPIRIGSRGMHSGDQSGVSWEVLAPEAVPAPPGSNEASLVLIARVHDVPILLLGDTGEQEQRALRLRYPKLRSTVLKVAHHGSRDQDPALTRMLGATWGLVSAGKDNGYGHPSTEALVDLAASGIGALRTDQHGSIALTIRDEHTIDVWVSRSTRQ